MPSEEEKQACLQWVAVSRGSNMEIYSLYNYPALRAPLLEKKGNSRCSLRSTLATFIVLSTTPQTPAQKWWAPPSCSIPA